MTSQADLFNNPKAVSLMAYLFAEKSGISGIEKAAIDFSLLPILQSKNGMKSLLTGIDMELGYLCYEFYRQNHERDFFDLLLKNMASDCSALLDIGCGAGATMLALTADGSTKSFTGIDLKESRIDLLRQLVERGAFGQAAISAQVADAHHLPFDNEAFELVYSRATLQYLNIESALSEMIRVLRPGGKLFLHAHGSGYPLHYFISRGGWRRKKNLEYIWHKLRNSTDRSSSFYTSQGHFLRASKLIENLLSHKLNDIHSYTHPTWMFYRCFPIYFVVTAVKPL